MYTVIRRYANAPGLFDAIIERQSEVQELIRGVPGFVGYYLVHSGDGGASITVCESKEGCDESSRRAAEWVRSNMPDLASAAPEITEGETVLRFDR